ncbi:MAG TPA: alpha/beta hydrolase [Bacteroidales bacterium]|nr:alpha/beta hydrolase [Bacteroidales bacterium]
MYSTIHGRKIWYTDSGKGFPVMLVHGYLESSEVWNGFSDRLSSEFRVIAIDLPGHGRSEVYSETHSMELMAYIIRELLEKLGINKVFLTGHSLGGYVTLAFLDLYPQYLSGYCLFHSHPLADSPEVTEKRKKDTSLVMEGKKDLMYPDNIEKSFASVNLEKMKEAVRTSKKIASVIPGNGIIALLNGMMKRPSRVNVMEEGRVPCLWILGAMDNYIPYGIIQQKVKLPSNARIVELKKSGHMGFVEEEELAAKSVSGFIGSL